MVKHRFFRNCAGIYGPKGYGNIWLLDVKKESVQLWFGFKPEGVARIFNRFDKMTRQDCLGKRGVSLERSNTEWNIWFEDRQHLHQMQDPELEINRRIRILSVLWLNKVV